MIPIPPCVHNPNLCYGSGSGGDMSILVPVLFGIFALFFIAWMWWALGELEF